MNVMRFAILGVAFIAAAAAVLLARGMLGGGTPSSQAAPPPAVAVTEVLVAAKDIAPGHVLDVDSVRFEAWPKTSVTTGLITKDVQPDVAKAVAGIVVRAPLVTGQPITEASIVRAGAAGFLAATIKPGMRAIGVPVNAETSAGGFILPNDRVDVVLTRDMSAGSGKKDFHSETILRDVRVLAVDQTAHQEKDQQTVVGKTATLELNPDQAVLLAQAQQMGVVSLALRALGDSSGEPVTAMENKRPPAIFAAPRRARDNTVTVFRYGVRRDSNASGGGAGSASGAGAAASNSNPDSGAVAPPPMAANTPQ